jgi:hypothetical protein
MAEEVLLRATAMANYSFSFNDAALGVPGFEGIFYPNNHGSADVTNTCR